MDAIDNPATARAAIKRLGLDGSMEPGGLLENLTVEQLESTVFIRLSYKDADPERAQRIANAVCIRPANPRVGACISPHHSGKPQTRKERCRGPYMGLMGGPVLAILMDERASRS
jgi:hypothetical protein